MSVDAISRQRIDLLIWAIIAAIAACFLVLASVFAFRIDWLSFVKPVLSGALLALGGLFYRRFRRDERMATGLLGTAQLVLFTSAAAPLSYIAASANRPLWDATFAQWDKWLGLDWMAMLNLMNDSPMLHWLFWLAYFSFMLQASTTMIGLAFSGRMAQLRIFMLSFIIATLMTVAIATVMPAEGVWGYLKLKDVDYSTIVPATRDIHLPIFHGLRDGSLRTLVAYGAEGIITFPSLHSAVALLFIFTFWPVKYLRWPAIILNILMIGSTPIDGGHYFSDVIAGLFIAALSWKASLVICARLSASANNAVHANGTLKEPVRGIAAS